MRRLVIDTATRACSVALFESERCIASFCEEIGRGHAERLVPMIAKLPDNGKAASIHVNVGPGSFTGIRVGVSAARALALAWNAECHGYGCLDLIAAMARNGEAIAVDVVMVGGHGEVYFQPFDGKGSALADAVSVPLDRAALASKAERLAGDKAHAMAEIRGSGSAFGLLPDASSWLAIAQSEPLAPAPYYVRGPDAKLPGGITA
jgi:tRNA threonylcarbamoyl adenosine modification protein YeaZ